MKYPNKDYIEHLRRKYPPGTRLQLSCMEDDFPVPPWFYGHGGMYRRCRANPCRLGLRAQPCAYPRCGLVQPLVRTQGKGR